MDTAATSTTAAGADAAARRRRRGRVGSVVSGGVVVALGLVSGYFVAIGYLAEPGRTDTAIHSAIGAGLGLVVAALTGLLTWGFVKAGRLHAWWFILPALLAAAALLRLTAWAPAPYGETIP